MYEFNIHCISFLQEPFFNKMEFLGEAKNIKNGDFLTFKKGNDFFNGKQRKIVSLKLISNQMSITFFFEYFKDYNHAYCFLDNPGITFCLLFYKMDNIKVIVETINSTKTYKIDQYDTNKTKYRRRYTMINMPFLITKINEEQINLLEHISKFDRKTKSFQLSFYNLKYIVVQPIELLENDNNNLQNIFEKNNDIFKTFNKKLKKILELENMAEIKSKNKELIKECKNIKIPEYFLNKSKIKLKAALFNQDILDFYYNSTIFYLYIFLYRRKKKLKWDTIKNMFSYLYNLCEKIKKDDSLIFIYQKVLLIEQLKGIISKIKKPKDLFDANFSYYVMNKKKENSILYFIEQFFMEYISKISEDCKIFFKLLQIDSGKGYYENEEFYCFNMANLEEIQNHLKQIFIEILTTYKYPSKACAFTNRRTGFVSINVKFIPNINKFDLYKTLKNEEIIDGKNIAARIISYLLHEVHGHTKFLYDQEKISQSPSNFIENNEIYSLKSINSNSNNKNHIKLLSKNASADDGTFYELVYGKIGDYYTFEIMDKTNEYGELVDNVELWINDLDNFKSYFMYKYIIQKKKIPIDNAPKDIMKKIDYFKDIIKNNEIDIDLFYTKNKSSSKINLNPIENKEKEYEITNKFDEKNEGIGNIEEEEEEEEAEEEEAEEEEEEEAEEEEAGEEEEEEKNTNFDKMNYDDLVKLLETGNLKGKKLFDCQLKIIEKDIIENIKNSSFE